MRTDTPTGDAGDVGGPPGRSGGLLRLGGLRRAADERRPARSFVLLRQIDADTPLHRMWAGTKLVAAAGISLTLSLLPTWPTIAITGALLVGGSLVARVPANAVPRPPRWFWLAAFIGAVLTLVSGGSPYVGIVGVHVGLGNLVSYVQFTLVSVLLLAAGALIGWTTPLGDIGPATGRLLGPLKRLRLPVDEWATAIALCIRSLPLVVDELRTLIAARRLRPSPRAAGARGVLDRVDAAGDLLISALAVGLRRAAEMGEAMTARGGVAGVTARAPGPRARDGVAVAVVAVGCACAWLVPQ